MENKENNKFEHFASLFHDQEKSEQAGNVLDDDFQAVEKIYNLREKVNKIAQLTLGEEAWKKIEWRLVEKKSFTITRRLRNFRYAAIFILLVALTGVAGIMIFQSSQTKNKITFTEVASSTGEMREVVLPDESKIWIGASSSLKYSSEFGQKNREIIFNGEAMFDIKKAELPFQVTLDNASIKVHGTKFLVTSYSQGSNNEVILLEGKIKYHDKNKSYNMSPGERLTDNHLTGNITKNQINTEYYCEWVNGKVYLDNCKLNDLIFLMEQWYGATFTFESNPLKTYKFTGVINKTETLDYNLNIITLTNKVKFYKNEHGVIIIND
ncbi:FecR family protein [Mariniphaga sediminis]|uniref:FecR family protein n=1 Tax=Mariniphaga sediminis TaxID=1628158 RepID=A0A399D7J1_9BACT|nr:FecR family protein [Mariniphaga sediminis]RIH67243.1 FecR family protein [Mariniphaga sediminis]